MIEVSLMSMGIELVINLSAINFDMTLAKTYWGEKGGIYYVGIITRGLN